jgi:transposase
VSRQQQGVSSQLSSSPSSSNGRLRGDVTDPEVMPPCRRRQFTAAYKHATLEEADRCRRPGEVGALLRREGLYSSHLTRWRVQLRAGQLEPRKRGRKANPQATEVARLQRENARLQIQLERAELVIDAQKKLCQLFNLPSEPEEIE